MLAVYVLEVSIYGNQPGKLKKMGCVKGERSVFIFKGTQLCPLLVCNDKIMFFEIN